MIICLCKNVSDRQIKQMTQQGDSFAEVVTKSMAGTCCGACVCDVRELVKNEQGTSRKNRESTPHNVDR